ncbi:MAG TPA: menaquinone biosynthesis decarboxylase [Gemmataceae bacterium]|jgi:4-hydroxy-3-polyprenylbenzoate decarboxylase|nr:menaquinone biosynthesis decarboxylase [Gemmataceae bacterium]
MAYESLAAFLEELEAEGQLVRIRAEVDPILEISEITDRISKAHGPALLFENVRGSRFPLAINVLGSERRMAKALGVKNLDEVAERIAEMIKPDIPDSFLGKVKMVPMLARLGSIPPRTVRTGPCQDVVLTGDQIDLTQLPVIQCWPEDAGRFITFGQVFTRNPETGDRNVGMYRQQLMDRRTTAMHWHPHHDGCQHFLMHKRLGTRMPLAISLGGDPVYPYMATAPLPPATDECLFGGFLRGKPVELAKCKSIDLEVPAGADFVIEGYLDPAEPLVTEGPFGDHTGFYSLADQFPLFHVTALTHRANPIYPTTIVGKPPQEDCYMGKATERLFLPLIKLFIPEVVDYDLPWFGVFHNFAFVSIRKRYPQHARKVMSAIWGLGQMMFSKIIVIVDEHVNVHNHEEVWFHVGANVHPGRDVVFNQGPTDLLDHAAPVSCVGHKMGIDATRKLPEEGHPREWPGEMLMSPEVIEKVSRRWQEYGIGADPGPVGRGHHGQKRV